MTVRITIEKADNGYILRDVDANMTEVFENREDLAREIGKAVLDYFEYELETVIDVDININKADK